MLFVLSKLAWFALDPSNLLLGALVAGALLASTRWRRAGRRLVTLAAFSALAVTVVPVGLWLLVPLENRFPVPAQLPARADGIVTLGGAVDQVVTAARGQAALLEAAERLTTFVALARRYPEARLVYSGGSGLLTWRALRETAAGRMALEDVGLDTGRVVFEGESRNTYENALLSRELVRPKPGETWILITSAAHMPRSVGIFRKAGWPVVPYPVDFRTTGQLGLLGLVPFGERLEELSDAAREWVGLVAYRVMGRTDALFPAP
jgi:uncharacterized SAM-binding protein YcdF (DUF218 family)